jgi:putative FmdB family regulatory protein
MPIYEYQCSNCGHVFEVIQKINEEPITLCPQCNQPKVIKLVSASGFQLKGTGWYVTDFKNKKTTESASSEKPKTETSKTGSSNSKEGKTD